MHGELLPVKKIYCCHLYRSPTWWYTKKGKKKKPKGEKTQMWLGFVLLCLFLNPPVFTFINYNTKVTLREPAGSLRAEGRPEHFTPGHWPAELDPKSALILDTQGTQTSLWKLLEMDTWKCGMWHATLQYHSLFTHMGVLQGTIPTSPVPQNCPEANCNTNGRALQHDKIQEPCKNQWLCHECKLQPSLPFPTCL